MSNSRQPAVRSFSLVCTADYVWRGRRSDWAQLVTAEQGMLTVQTDAGWWVAPPGQAVWLPPNASNSIEMGGRVVLWALYLRASLARGLAGRGQVIELSPLLRELFRRILAHKTLARSIPVEARLVAVLRDELSAMRPEPLDLARPRDPRAARAAALLRQRTEPTRATLLREAGASSRTLERLFKAETGLSLGAWRRRARLLRALQLLADGSSVTQAGLLVGYESTSAFVAAFRRQFGRTPGKYFAPAKAPEAAGRPH
jgi:AraC-like DNA-binding protein